MKEGRGGGCVLIEGEGGRGVGGVLIEGEGG